MLRIKEIRVESQITQQRLAKAVGVSRSTIAMWESGATEPDTACLKKLADIFDVSVDYLLGRTDIKKEPEGSTIRFFHPNVTEDYVTFPVIGEIAAGYDFPATEDWSGETVDIPTAYLHGRSREDFFVLRVHGDSMYPLYMDGDKVLIRKQTSLDHSGQIGAVLYAGDMATLKKVEYKPGEDWMRLIPSNPMYPPMMVTGADLEECRILGIPKLLIREIED